MYILETTWLSDAVPECINFHTKIKYWIIENEAGLNFVSGLYELRPVIITYKEQLAASKYVLPTRPVTESTSEPILTYIILL